ncbi:CPBP family intramembrane glutamic endopeptidase [Diplocloster modestus]|uniref:CPBP family intramembrane metalloprotease n=1 Tax=Diplocloster modestus TaxID=2850322 RepID=A0ABS6KD03_9FIRM|nr:CPBP family intramembrane glutamic endopeptidase [Diplocloster modestus]MBU9728378.1 CPBP family intramembrane metalloprotease [Diplocloster modestus]
MKKLWNNKLVKNKYGQVRSGWIILTVMVAYYLITYVLSFLLIEAMRKYLISTGDINEVTGELSAYVDWLNNVALPIIMQVLTDMVMILICVITWRSVMKRPAREMGLSSAGPVKKDCCVGMLLGIVSCTIVFFIIITAGGGHVVSLVPRITGPGVMWIIVFVLVAFGEEILNRGFIMGALRRTRNIYFIVLVPSVIFGLLHLMNPNVTFLSVLNIILVGILFSYMYIKSGNIWMCIGYHFTWNTFQGVIYGMPVSGLNIPGFITTEFTHDNILNGGGFGVEGGILTTIVILLGFLFVRYYYRNSEYDFINDNRKQKDNN